MTQHLLIKLEKKNFPLNPNTLTPGAWLREVNQAHNCIVSILVWISLTGSIAYFLTSAEECFNVEEMFKSLLIDCFKNLWRHVHYQFGKFFLKLNITHTTNKKFYN